MKKRKLIEIYSAYLPYELKLKTKSGIIQLTEVDVIGGYPVWASVKWCGKSNSFKPNINDKNDGLIGMGYKFKQVKPVLHPMSDVGMIACQLSPDFEKKFGWNPDVNDLSVEDYKILLMNHFNVFGLEDSQYCIKSWVPS